MLDALIIIYRLCQFSNNNKTQIFISLENDSGLIYSNYY